VSEAIAITQPWAVDVSGGVEIEAGIKSAIKIKDFIKAVMA
jgi:phosphoribosylanthranilate isomerase